jgi:hypothetical protein
MTSVHRGQKFFFVPGKERLFGDQPDAEGSPVTGKAAKLLALKERLETAWLPPASLLKNKCEKGNLALTAPRTGLPLE